MNKLKFTLKIEVLNLKEAIWRFGHSEKHNQKKDHRLEHVEDVHF